jgi:ParB-like nuclease domain
VTLTPISQIVVRPNRQRQEFNPDAMQVLKESIVDNGLLQAPVTRQEGGTTILVVGERRLRAIKELWELGSELRYAGKPVPVGMVPTVDIGKLTELEAEAAELDENLARKDLTWQEHAAAMARLHALRVKQKAAEIAAEIAANGFPVSTQQLHHTVADTALEVHGRSDGSFQDSIRRELIVARNLENPLIAKAKTADEAFKILKQAEAASKNRELAALIGATYTAEVHKLAHADAIDFMQLTLSLLTHLTEWGRITSGMPEESSVVSNTTTMILMNRGKSSWIAGVHCRIEWRRRKHMLTCSATLTGSLNSDSEWGPPVGMSFVLPLWSTSSIPGEYRALSMAHADSMSLSFTLSRGAGP